MEVSEIKNKGRARLFDNPVLESLTKTRPWIIYVIYIPLICYLLYYSYDKLNFSISFIVSLYIGALLFWSLFEYFAHRYLFHFQAKGDFANKIVYIFHGNHHEYPRDKMRLFMPPVPSIILASILFVIIWLCSYLIMGTANYSYIFFSGFISGYLAYVSMHYAIHAYAPPKFLKALWRNHHLHHYKYPEKGFGVSSIIWDVVFGTLPKKKD